MQNQNQALSAGRWNTFSLCEQMGNIGSEVERAINRKNSGEEQESRNALKRGLDLFDLSLADKRWKFPKLKEIARAREVVCDFIAGDNEYNSDEKFLNDYFLKFAIAARQKHHDET